MSTNSIFGPSSLLASYRLDLQQRVNGAKTPTTPEEENAHSPVILVPKRRRKPKVEDKSLAWTTTRKVLAASTLALGAGAVATGYYYLQEPPPPPRQEIPAEVPYIEAILPIAGGAAGLALAGLGGYCYLRKRKFSRVQEDCPEIYNQDADFQGQKSSLRGSVLEFVFRAVHQVRLLGEKLSFRSRRNDDIGDMDDPPGGRLQDQRYAPTDDYSDAGKTGSSNLVDEGYGNDYTEEEKPENEFRSENEYGPAMEDKYGDGDVSLNDWNTESPNSEYVSQPENEGPSDTPRYQGSSYPEGAPPVDDNNVDYQDYQDYQVPSRIQNNKRGFCIVS